ncbi:hypothetical protein [Microbispora rosea]
MQTQTAVLARTDAALLTGLCTYLDSLSDTAGARSEREIELMASKSPLP